ncbi:MAG: hydroxymethylbilane synthase [Planctomycetota bacterium]
MNRILRIATRNSPLALWQARDVQARLKGHGVDTELVPMTSAGDQNQQAIAGMRQVGVFTKRIQEAVLADQADLAVHSMKDLPTLPHPDLVIAAVPPRQDVRDAVIHPAGLPLADLPDGAVIGTGSLRRQAQIRNRHPHLQVKAIRGNVQRRLQKLHDREVDALMLANIGLLRLEMHEIQRAILSLDEMLPAVGQGALAVEVRAGDQLAKDAVGQIDDTDSRLAVTAERAFLRTLEGGCLAPIAAHATRIGDQIRMTAVVLSPDGGRRRDGHSQADFRGVHGSDPASWDAAAEDFGRSLAQEFIAENVVQWFR